MYGTRVNNKGKTEKNKKVLEGECVFPFKQIPLSLITKSNFCAALLFFYRNYTIFFSQFFLSPFSPLRIL